MNAAFVVTLTNINPGDDLTAIAEDIFDALSSDYVIVSVNPWERPITGQTPLTQPGQTPTGAPVNIQP